MVDTSEISRIRGAYQKRITSGHFARYSLLIPGELFMTQRREAQLLALLRKHGISNLHELKILEIGCGRGTRLFDWVRWGANAENLYGLDLMPELIDEAKKLMPHSHFFVGSAGDVGFEDHSFDIVVQFTVFTSIKDAGLKAQIAGQMRRLIKKDGLILWYDFRYNNPKNPDVQAVKPAEVKQLFAGCHIDGRTLTLLPPLARAIAPFSRFACRLLEYFPPFRSHYLAIIKE